MSFAQHLETTADLLDRCDVGQVMSVDTLPDDVLLAHYVDDDAQLEEESERAWQSLVHVCRRWRRIIFASPRHLKLQLHCTERTTARSTLDIWPALPLIISW